MKNNSYLFFILIIFLIIGAFGYFYSQVSSTTPAVSPTPSPTPEQIQAEITYPKGGENLVKGQIYTLQWTSTGKGETSIFLINKSLESQGVNASIADRIYHIPNTGSYSYTLPTNIPDGTYKLDIGTLRSNYFYVVSSNDAVLYCQPEDVETILSLNPTAGSVYGTFQLKNVTDSTCKITGNKFIHATYKAKNIAVDYKEDPGPATYTLSPNQTVSSQLYYSNEPQCPSGIDSALVNFTYEISPLESVTFMNQTNEKDIAILVCNEESEKTHLEIWAFSTSAI